MTEDSSALPVPVVPRVSRSPSLIRRQSIHRKMDTQTQPHESHEQLFPVHWIRRWPFLAVVSILLITFAAIGHTIGGIGELVRSLREVFSPAQKVTSAELSSSRSVTMELANDTRPLDGYQLIKSGSLPSSLQQGPVLPGGAQTRLVLQAADPGRIAQIDRISLQVERYMPSQVLAFDYTIDPRHQPGFGAAKPRRFNVVLEGTHKAAIFYIAKDNQTEEVPLDNILPKSTFPLLLLDAQAGLQETFDFAIVPSEPGFYKVSFAAHVISGHDKYDLHAGPLYIFRK